MTLPEPQFPQYPPANPVVRFDEKPLARVINKMLASRLRMPHGKVVNQNVKIKHKKIKYW